MHKHIHFSPITMARDSYQNMVITSTLITDPIHITSGQGIGILQLIPEVPEAAAAADAPVLEVAVLAAVRRIHSAV